jgi:hypothetical protein
MFKSPPSITGIFKSNSIFAKPNIYICEKPEFHTSEIEILWLEVIINNLKAMVGVIYRPPHSDVSYPIQYLDQGLIQYFLLIECSTIQFVYSASYFDNKRDF